jgi:hypothetical protein
MLTNLPSTPLYCIVVSACFKFGEVYGLISRDLGNKNVFLKPTAAIENVPELEQDHCAAMLFSELSIA